MSLLCALRIETLFKVTSDGPAVETMATTQLVSELRTGNKACIFCSIQGVYKDHLPACCLSAHRTKHCQRQHEMAQQLETGNHATIA